MRISSGTIDQVVYFVAVDGVDKETRKIGLTGFAVHRSRKGGSSVAMSIPTVTEIDAATMQGVYGLLVDEDTTVDAGDDTQALVFHITHAEAMPVTREIELYVPPAGGAPPVLPGSHIEHNEIGAGASPVVFRFETRVGGELTTPSAATYAVYPAGSSTAVSGVTVTVTPASSGLLDCSVPVTDAAFVQGGAYEIRFTAGTLDGDDQTGVKVGSFELRSFLNLSSLTSDGEKVVNKAYRAISAVNFGSEDFYTSTLLLNEVLSTGLTPSITVRRKDSTIAFGPVAMSEDSNSPGTYSHQEDAGLIAPGDIAKIVITPGGEWGSVTASSNHENQD